MLDSLIVSSWIVTVFSEESCTILDQTISPPQFQPVSMFSSICSDGEKVTSVKTSRTLRELSISFANTLHESSINSL